MTISANSTHELTIDKIVRRSYNMAGLLEAGKSVNSGDGELARELLDTILDELETQGLFARRVRFEEITLIADTYTYALDANIIDVVGRGMFIADGQTLDRASGEMPVEVISREQWQGLSSKDARGTPRMVFADRGGTVITLRFWPIPDAAGTVRLQTHKLSADTLEGQKTIDAERYWTSFFIWELAHHLAMAKGLPLARAAYYHQVAGQKLERCRAKSNEGVSNQMVVDHDTGWQR